MERITVNVTDDTLLPKIEARAAALRKRSLSDYGLTLIEDDLRTAGMLPVADDAADFHAKLNQALADDATIRPQIEKILRKSTRTGRTGKRAA